MTYQKALTMLIDDAYESVFHNADLIKDKLDFKPDMPSSKNRTPMDLLKEVVSAPSMFIEILKTQKMPENEDGSYPEGLDSIDACKKFWEKTKPELYAAIEAFPDEKLTETLETPWGTFTWVTFMGYLHWNPQWHAGQMAYIGLMHGDERM